MSNNDMNVFEFRQTPSVVFIKRSQASAQSLSAISRVYSRADGGALSGSIRAYTTCAGTSTYVPITITSNNSTLEE
ncbi:hypothetical protein EVAR_65239_1 [Eumeta japonica]|uniref:Uncharacterized protein n=1 Tax=Eumeta variegata TaxID=151549 RepID=A0A4C1ZFN2_EUMVA|nr:hypothetical protein EVAR_65239_1 [Eumeta japonica]